MALGLSPTKETPRKGGWMMGTALRIFCLLLSVAAALANPAETTKVLDIGSRLELFVDRYLIDRLEGARLMLHEPRYAAS